MLVIRVTYRDSRKGNKSEFFKCVPIGIVIALYAGYDFLLINYSFRLQKYLFMTADTMHDMMRILNRDFLSPVFRIHLLST